MRAKTFKQLQDEGTADMLSEITILKLEDRAREIRRKSLTRWFVFYTSILLIATPFIIKNSDSLKNVIFNYGLASFISVTAIIGITVMGNMRLYVPAFAVGMGVGVEAEVLRQRTRMFEKIMVPSLGYILTMILLFISWIL